MMNAPKTKARPHIPHAARHVKGWRYFAGLFGGEHIAATEFVIGVTFVLMGVGVKELLLGLLIGNTLAVLSWTLVTTPLAVETRLSLFAYLEKIAGPRFARIYNGAIVLFYGALAAAMITVSAFAIRFVLGIPAQPDWHPSSLSFVAVVLVMGAVVVLVACNGFEAMANLSTVCAPWMLVCFVCGGLVALPTLALAVQGSVHMGGVSGFLDVARETIWTGTRPDGTPGISVWEVAAFAWANGAMVHLGLIDMAIFRFARRKSYGLLSGIGMFLGHYVGWLAAGLMGAGAAVMLGQSLLGLDSGDVAHATLGFMGLLVVTVAGWTTANSCLYRAGLAAASIFPDRSRKEVTIGVGTLIVIVACFPFVARSILPLTVYGAMLLAPVGAIVLTEHALFPRLGLTRYWSRYRGDRMNRAALLAWGLSLAFAVVMDVTGAMSFYFIFLPEYLLALVLYTALAAMMGARRAFPAPEARQEAAEDALAAFEERREAREADEEVPPTPRLARVCLVLGGGVLAVLVALALRAGLWPGTEAGYSAAMDDFKTVAPWLTLVYFVLTTLAMRIGAKAEDAAATTPPA